MKAPRIAALGKALIASGPSSTDYLDANKLVVGRQKALRDQVQQQAASVIRRSRVGDRLRGAPSELGENLVIPALMIRRIGRRCGEADRGATGAVGDGVGASLSLIELRRGN